MPLRNPHNICEMCQNCEPAVRCLWSDYATRDPECRAHLSWERGRQEGIALERARVVGWLDDSANWYTDHDDHELSTAIKVEMEEIERGDHAK